MPFVSKSQIRWGMSPAGRKALGEAGQKEWIESTPKGLPEKVTKDEPNKNKKLYQ